MTDLSDIELVPPVWKFDFLSMNQDQLKAQFNLLSVLLRDIEENPYKYSRNFIELETAGGIEPKKVICLLPLNTFRGYVVDALDILKKHYLRGFSE